MVQLKPTVLFLDKVPDGLCPVHGMTIDYKKDRPRRIDHQAPQEVDEHRSRHPSLGQHET